MFVSSTTGTPASESKSRSFRLDPVVTTDARDPAGETAPSRANLEEDSGGRMEDMRELWRVLVRPVALGARRLEASRVGGSLLDAISTAEMILLSMQAILQPDYSGQ